MSRRAAALAALLAVVLAGCGSSGGDRADGGQRPTIRLGTKNFTEQFVLGQVYAQALRAKGFKVVVKQDIGSSELIDRALTNGAIDLYAEYTGVIVTELAHQPTRPTSAEDGWRRARAFENQRGFELLRPSPGADAVADAVLPATARRYRLHSTPDLKRLGRFRYGGPAENEFRFQGAVGVRRVYGLDFDYVPLDIDARYQALERGDVDVVEVFTTEGQLLQRKRYRVLSDPKGIFGYQNIAPVVSRAAVRAQGPVFTRTLDAVTAKLTARELRKMNAAVDLRGDRPVDVARRFLRDNRLP